MRHLKSSLLALSASLALVACGGGNSADTTPRSSVGAVKVFGDSLADSGTFGYKFTVQVADNLIYPERVAAAYGKTLCPYYQPTSATTFVVSPAAGCTNYAIGGGRINTATAPTSKTNVRVQLVDAGATGFAASDLVIIDGGGNDGADLVGAYLQAAQGSTANFVGLMASMGVTISAPGAAGLAAAGTAYMTNLADAFAASITANVLSKGATQVVVLNIPAITKTPRFQMVLASLGANGPAAEALFEGWLAAFNTELASKFAAEPKVAVIDFYDAFKDQFANPTQFGLSNVTTPACPAVGLDSTGLPTYDFPTCTAASLSANIPAGASGGADWWKTYAFSDSFHPTPYGHQLVAQLISKTLAIKGWL